MKDFIEKLKNDGEIFHDYIWTVTMVKMIVRWAIIILVWLKRNTVEHIGDCEAKKNVERLKKQKIIHPRIKVGFLVQMPEIWNKQESVYEEMKNRECFEPWLIIVPALTNGKNEVGDYGEEQSFFINKCIDKNYILAYSNKKWVNLKEYEFDYVFYQRPYDNYLPQCLRSGEVAKYSRVCYIPYSSAEAKNTVVYPHRFCRNVYFGFLEDEYFAECNNRRFDSGFRRFYNIGYPIFQKCMSINCNEAYISFLWTPRWSYHPVLGGSHFLEYNENLTIYNWGTKKFGIRPHPMMWDYLIREGYITQQQKTDIKQLWREKGFFVDDSKDITETFIITDVLITDTSSIIAMFFLTGKPIIYCPMKLEPSPLLASIIPGLYIANNWDELKKLIEMLASGNDPKKKLRGTIIRASFMHHKNAVDSIVDCIYNDNLLYD